MNSNAKFDAKTERETRCANPSGNSKRESIANFESKIERENAAWKAKMGTGKWYRNTGRFSSSQRQVSSSDFRVSSFDFQSYSLHFRVAALGVVLGYAAFQWGGVLRTDQYEFLLVLGLLATACSLARPGNRWAPPPGRALRWAAVLLPAYVLLQAVPLPVAVLRVASPLRARAVAALEPIGAKVNFAPLSVSPAATFQHFLLLSGYVVVFFLVRELTLHFGAIPLARFSRGGAAAPFSGWRDKRTATIEAEENRRWIVIAPIVTIAALEAGLGLWQNFGRTGEATQWGTYVNHNHYAGFLEMALPFAVMYPVALLGRARRLGNMSLAPPLAACGVWGLAGVMVAGIVHSFSRMGFIATLGSVLVMGTLAFGNRPLGWLGSSRKRRCRALQTSAVGAASSTKKPHGPPPPPPPPCPPPRSPHCPPGNP
jgi:hypothetical protein